MGRSHMGRKASKEGSYSMTDLENQLYNSLKNCPCKCIYAWDMGPYNPKAHDTLEGRRIVKKCPRCEACEEYERINAWTKKEAAP